LKKKIVHIFVFDGFADWEIAYVTPHIERSREYALQLACINGESVTSMGGLRVNCSCRLTEIDYNKCALLVLPGGDPWEKQGLQEIIPVVEKCVEKQIPVAAICAATTLLGRMNLLNSIRHTSNSRGYLEKFCPTYTGQDHYAGGEGYHPTAITDDNIITSSGVAAVDFTKEIMHKLRIYDDATIEKWYQLFKNGVWNE